MTKKRAPRQPISGPVKQSDPFLALVAQAESELRNSALARWTPRQGDVEKVYERLLRESWDITSNEKIDLITLSGLLLGLAGKVYSFGDHLYRDAQF